MPALCLGQWLVEMAVLLGKHSVLVSIARSPLQEQCTGASCFLGGSVVLDGEPIASVGDFAPAEGVAVQLENKVHYTNAS